MTRRLNMIALAVTASAMSGAAFAGSPEETPVEAPVYAPAPVPVNTGGNWTGF